MESSNLTIFGKLKPTDYLKILGSIVSGYLILFNDYAVFYADKPLSKLFLFIPILMMAASLLVQSRFIDGLVIVTNTLMGTVLPFKLINMEILRQDSVKMLGSVEVHRMWTPADIEAALISLCHKHNLAPSPTELHSVLNQLGTHKMSQLSEALVKVEELVTSKQIALQNAAARAASNQVFFDNLWYYGIRLAFGVLVVGTVYYYFTSGSLAAQINDVSKTSTGSSELLNNHISKAGKVWEENTANFKFLDKSLTDVKGDLNPLKDSVNKIAAEVKDTQGICFDFIEYAQPAIDKLAKVMIRNPGGTRIVDGNIVPSEQSRLLDVLIKMAEEYVRNR